MTGAILTFVFVCAIVAIYMSIVHSFLRASEEPEDVAREKERREFAKSIEPQQDQSSHTTWAH